MAQRIPGTIRGLEQRARYNPACLFIHAGRCKSHRLHQHQRKGLAMRESDIVHECKDFWVSADRQAYVVWRIGVTHSISDSAYPKTEDGLTIAKARCNYLQSRKDAK